ncbi:MAG: hypothetical protein LBG84_09855 [Treponema sp.]|jgi:hypothetical protein|nr:hypothetical protein [Treponema sp.]
MNGRIRYRVLLAAALFAAAAGGLAAQGLTVSGLLDSTVSARAGAGDAPAFSYGLEEYAGLRFQAKARDKAVVYGAVNLIAAAGNAAVNTALAGLYQGGPRPGLSPSAFSGGENYVAGLELERLYFRVNGEYLDFDGGLTRLPFGYGQVWGPSDFLNPKNPLYPDARPRGVLGGVLAWYPAESLKVQGFGAAPRDPFAAGGQGALAGLAVDRHGTKASFQALYAFEAPRDGSPRGIHRVGMSLKADLELGLTVDALYAYNPQAGMDLDGLSLSAGFDYSFFGGKLIVLAEYLYNGGYSSTSVRGGGAGGLSHRNYLYGGLTWMVNDYTSAGLALLAGVDDLSCVPILSLSRDLFQGCTLSLAGQVPLDRDLFTGSGEGGELGPESAGGYFNFSGRVRLRF